MEDTLANTKETMKLAETPEIRSNDKVVLELWVRAGGRCEFHGCNTYLFQDELTTRKAKLANIAHIVGRKRNAARGDDPLPFERRNDIENLMLTCQHCHGLIDNKELVAVYPKELLARYKTEHEERIRVQTEQGPEHETYVIRVMGNIRGDSVAISTHEIQQALFSDSLYPRYLRTQNTIEIDLTGLPKEVDEDYWTMGIKKIDEVIATLVNPGIDGDRIKHISVFAFARIPFLVHFGNRLGDKVRTRLYQKHRDGGEGWVWKETDNAVAFSVSILRKGTDPTKVAVTLALSGRISLEELPKEITNGFTVYEICPIKEHPNRELIRSEADLNSFRMTYGKLLAEIKESHGSLAEIHLFPAIPVSVAVTCGRELLKNVHPAVVVYDKIENQYSKTIQVRAR